MRGWHGAVIVGVDGSQDATTGLAWALRHAQVAGLAVCVVHAWSPDDTTPAARAGLSAVTRHGQRITRDRAMSEAEARDRLHQAVAAASAKVPIGRSLITQLAVRGEPGAVLVDLSTDGAQLVVGATGSDALPGIVTPMLGSTTRFVLRHAWCPVTVVPSARLRRAAPEPIEPQSVAEYSSRQREDTTGGPDDPGFGDVPSARLPGAGS